MSSSPQPAPEHVIPRAELRSPGVAALLAWLIPGAGHFYQKRFVKSVLFFVCILGTYFFGLAMGGGKVVYASLAPGDFRWQYFCQVGVGAPALPAIVQNRLARQGKPWGDYMRPPMDVRDAQSYDELAQWHEEYHRFFEIGTLYTMIAGLLNILAVYDAAFGPFVPLPEESPPDPSNGSGSGKDEDEDEDDPGAQPPDNAAGRRQEESS